MKRKVNLVGNNTLTISLPSKWTKKYNLKKGDEIEVVENGPELKINPAEIKINKEVTINIDNAISSLVWRYLKSAYMQGYDTIIVEFSKKKLPYTSKETRLKGEKREILITDLLYTIASRLTGMVVVDQTKNKFILKNIKMADDIDIDVLLKRVFQNVKTQAEKIREVLITKDKEEFENIIAIENNINNFVDYLTRVLNKKNISGGEYYTVVVFLEKIADSFFRIFEKYLKFNLSSRSKEDLKYLDKIISIYSRFYHAYWFNKKELPNLYIESKYLNIELEKKEPTEISFEIRHICDQIQDAVEPALMSICKTMVVEE